MRSRLLIVAVPGRRPRIEHRGAVAARLTGPDTVHLVSAAATPLGGDTVEVAVCVEPGARLTLRSVAASVALPSATQKDSESSFDGEVAGDLDVALQPVIVAADARHRSAVTLRLHGAATLRYAERVQIGRHGEADGFFCGAMRADCDDHPLLRHRIEVGAGSVSDDAVSRPAAMTAELRYGGPPPGDGQGATVLALARGGWLSTWQGDRLPPR